MPRKIGHVKSSEITFGGPKRKGKRKKVREILGRPITPIDEEEKDINEDEKDINEEGEDISEGADPIGDVDDIMPLSAHDRKYISQRTSALSMTTDEEWGSLFDSE